MKQKPTPLETVRVYEKQILIGFLYIPEAQYLKANINSFITCRPFGQEESSRSRLVRNTSNPIFNFTQLVPLVYQDDLLQQLRENVMVIEFWERFETKDILLGLTKLPLHQYYVAYRNPDVTKYLCNNKLPIISSDWWEPITNPYTEELLGQVQILLALGTEQQIQNLELERGFKTHTVRANFETPFENKKIETSSKTINNDKEIRKFVTGRNNKGRFTIQPKPTDKVGFKGGIGPPVAGINKESDKALPSTEDKGVQSDFEMNTEENKGKEATSNDKLGQLLNQIIAMQTQRSNVTEMGTNTDNEGVESNANKLSRTKKTDLPGLPDGLLLPTSSARTAAESNSFSSSKQYENAPPLVRSTSDLLNTLQAALSIPPAERPLISANRATAVQDNKQKVLSKHIRTSFKAQVSINQALHLPVRKKCKSRKSKGKSGRGDDNVKPSCYVTYETMPGLDLKMTPLVSKSTNPNWNYKCDVFLPAELLLNNQKRLIFKVWRKSTNTTMVPNLQSDLILGFAAVDLTVLLSGFPNIQGWFNIIDFSSKCNGQINVHITPLEDLTVFKTQKETYMCSVSPSLSGEDNKNVTETTKQKSSQQVLQEIEEDDDEADSELLSRALKRKFTELDEITQRLRLRLSHVTNEESDDGNDDIADQFERDINALSIEDDYDMINFQEENQNVEIDDSHLLQLQVDCSGTSSLCDTENSSVQLNSVNSNVSLMMVPTQEEVTKEFEHTEESLSILDRQLLEGKQRIDTLLGKLSLISGDANSFSSRYVSGCSASNRSESTYDIDTEAILKDLDLHSRPNIHASTSYDNHMFDHIYEVAGKRIGSDSSPSSGTSVISNLAELRAAPDGQGTFSEDRNKVKK